MDDRSLEVRFADRRAAGEPAADETRPVLVPGPGGEILLLYERLKAGEDRRLAARLIAAGK
jgi:hypothetical protein